MDSLIMILAPCEMLLVNLFFINKCLEKKYSRLRTYVCLALCAIPIFAFAFFASQSLPGFGDGSGSFIFFSFLFLIPIKLLYRDSIARIITISCTIWIYTFLLFALSVNIAYLFPATLLAQNTVIIQTILYAATLYFIYKLVKAKLIPMLGLLSRKNLFSLMWLSILWFWALYAINLVFIYPEYIALRAIIFITLAICVLQTYRVFYRIVFKEETIQTLEKIAYHDDLTQLRSRTVLHSDASDLIDRALPFYLIFIDLDKFKSINDSYGHNIGDEYLNYFAHEVKIRLGSSGGFYRIAGDEFVCLFLENSPDAFIKDILSIPRQLPDEKTLFLGFSYGIARYPDDGTDLRTLIEVADQKMYDMKRGKHRKK